MRSLIPVIAALVVLSGCHAKANAPGEAPSGVTVMPGDGLVVVNWDVLPDLTYWIFYQAGSSVDVASPNSTAIRRAIAPRIVTGLTNETQYAFAMNATHNDSAAGPSSTPMVATPMLAGINWAAGTPQGTANLKDIAFSGTRFVIVGDAAVNGTTTTPTIFAGDFNYPVGEFNFQPGDPQGVTEWMPPVTLPLNFALDLISVIFVPGAYVALNPSGPVILSADGLNWTQPGSVQSGGVPATGLSAIGFGFVAGVSTYVVVGAGGAIYVNSGGNLLDWTLPNSNTPNDLNGIFVLNGSFLATGTGGTLDTSPDGITWTPQITNTSNTLRGVAFCPLCAGVRYVAVGDAGTIITSNIGVDTPLVTDWTPVSASNITFIPPLTGPLPNLKSVTVGGAAGTRFLAVGDSGVIVFSDDGISWTALLSGATNLSSVLYNQGLYLSVGDAGTNVVSR